MVSKKLAAIVTLPFDVVKTLRQLEFGENVIHSGNEPQYTNKLLRSAYWFIDVLYFLDEPPKKASTTKQIIQKIYRQRGIGGLFAGFSPRIAKIGSIVWKCT